MEKHAQTPKIMRLVPHTNQSLKIIITNQSKMTAGPSYEPFEIFMRSGKSNFTQRVL